MPELQEHDLSPVHVCKGDTFFWKVNGVWNDSEVVSVTPKVKFVYIQTADEATHKVSRDAKVKVQRVVPTADERLADRRESLRQAIGFMHEAAEQSFRKAVAELTKCVGVEFRDGGRHDDAGYEWASYVRRMHEWELWQLVGSVAVQNPKCEGDVLKATALVVREKTKELIDKVRFGSHSSSEVSNLVAGWRNEATAQFLDSFRYDKDLLDEVLES